MTRDNSCQVEGTDKSPSACLAKNSFNEDKCRAEVDALYDCCNAFYDKNGDQASTVSCPKANLLRLKMRQRAQESETR